MVNAPFIFDSLNESDTDRLGRALAAALLPGTVVALNGELGSGKTRFVRAVCEGLGADISRVNSPTFVLMQFYVDGRIPVVHMDTYRIGDVDEFIATGAEEYLHDGKSVSFIEWADLISEILPEDLLRVEITQTSVTGRQFSFTATGTHSEMILKNLRSNLC
ncbi:MAG: tRNA (adenosine(37)-N6)-threonylcarbamoyltransferase complex ATPase subunit type 1 TsaE [Planctomyces sp.]